MNPAFQRSGPVWALDSSIWAASPPRIRLGLSESRPGCSNLSAKRASGAAANWPPPRDRRASPNPVRLGRTFANWPRPAARVTLRAAFGATICVPVAQRIERPPSKRKSLSGVLLSVGRGPNRPLLVAQLRASRATGPAAYLAPRWSGSAMPCRAARRLEPQLDQRVKPAWTLGKPAAPPFGVVVSSGSPRPPLGWRGLSPFHL